MDAGRDPVPRLRRLVAEAGVMTGPYVRDGVLVSPCDCGGEVIAARDTPDELRNAVAYHSAQRDHAAWRRRRSTAGEPAELLGELGLRLGGRAIGRAVRAGLLLDGALEQAVRRAR
jgi:hypothetical protein